MSLLQPCRQALSRPLVQRTCASIRLYSNEGPAGSIDRRQPGDVVPGAPVQEIIPAEAISGAPGA